MLNWLIYALIAPAMWALMNHLDKYLIDCYCKDKTIGSLIVYSGLIGLPFSLLIYLINGNEVFSLPSKDIVLLVLDGAIYICSITAYLKALGRANTSNVAPLFQISSVISLILGYMVFGEIISINQLIGSFVILIGSLGLVLIIDNNIKIGRNIFLLMSLSSLLISVGSVLFKIAAKESNIWVSFFWVYIGYFIYTAILFMLHRNIRREFFQDFRSNSAKIITLNVLNEVFTAFGNLAFNQALLMAPIGLVYFIGEGFQPFFVLIFGILITKIFPKLGQENISADHLTQKVLAITLMAVGVYLIAI